MLRFGLVASSLFAAAACGKVDAFVDAGPADSSPYDAVVDPDARNEGNVTVTTHARAEQQNAPDNLLPGAIVPGVAVFVVQPDGTLGDSGVTDENGQIVLENVQQGAGVTAVYDMTTNFSQYDIVTVVGVKPGDSLTFGEYWEGSNQPVTYATASFNAHTGTYKAVYGPCGYNYSYDPNGTSTSVTNIPQYDYCQGAGTPPQADLLFVTGTSCCVSSIGDMLGYRVLRGANFADGQALAFGTISGTPQNFSFTVTGVPSGVEEFNTELSHILGATERLQPNSYSNPITSGTGGYIQEYVPNLDAYVASIRMYRNGNLGQHSWFARLAGDAQSFGGTPPDIPWVADHSSSATLGYVRWELFGTTPYDATLARVFWQRDLPAVVEGGEGGDIDYEWTLLLPPGVTEWTWGAVPEELEPFVPTENDNIYSFMGLVELEAAEGYDGMRALPESTFTDPERAAVRGAITGGGVLASGDGGEGFTAQDLFIPPMVNGF